MRIPSMVSPKSYFLKQAGIEPIDAKTFLFKADHGSLLLPYASITGFRIREADFKDPSYGYMQSGMIGELFKAFAILLRLRPPVNPNKGAYWIFLDTENGTVQRTVMNINVFGMKRALTSWFKTEGECSNNKTDKLK